MSLHVISCNFMSCHVKSCHVMWNHAMPAKSCHVVSTSCGTSTFEQKACFPYIRSCCCAMAWWMGRRNRCKTLKNSCWGRSLWCDQNQNQNRMDRIMGVIESKKGISPKYLTGAINKKGDLPCLIIPRKNRGSFYIDFVGYPRTPLISNFLLEDQRETQ